jgi:hypothetical protein
VEKHRRLPRHHRLAKAAGALRVYTKAGGVKAKIDACISTYPKSTPTKAQTLTNGLCNKKSRSMWRSTEGYPDTHRLAAAGSTGRVYKKREEARLMPVSVHGQSQPQPAPEPHLTNGHCNKKSPGQCGEAPKVTPTLRLAKQQEALEVYTSRRKGKIDACISTYQKSTPTKAPELI